MAKIKQQAAGAEEKASPPQKVRRVSRKAKTADAPDTPENPGTVGDPAPPQDSGAEQGAEHNSNEPREVEGLRLIQQIRRTLIERNLPERHIADIMGVTTIYWNSMTNGHRKIKSLGRDKLKKIAEFLGLPPVQVRVLAGDILVEDFLVEKDLDDQLFLSVEKMRLDPQWVVLAPTNDEWAALPLKMKVLTCTLYERDTGRSILAKAKVEFPGMEPGVSPQ